MENMSEIPEEYLPQVNRTLTFIRLELLQLANDCEYMQMYRPNPQVFRDLEYYMLKILHETRAVFNPPPIKPKKSDFDMVEHIASGTFGTVSHVRHKQTRQSFAMKQIKQNEQLRAMALMERDILNYLEHPFIIPMFCSFETERHMYLVMEYAGGGNCLELLRKHNPLSLEASCFYIAELVLAVEHLHSVGIIHRDLKPENLLISSQGHLKVADFGLAKFGSMTMVDYHHDAEAVAKEFIDGESFGTISYMAPELFLDMGYGKPVDWWAVGCILFNFLFGTMPFPGETTEMYRENVIEGQIVWPMNLPFDTGSLLSRLLDTNPVPRLGTRGAYEVKACPFFCNVHWEYLMYQTPPCVPKPEDMTSCSQMSPSLVLMEDHFCHVGFHFREVYGSPKSLWTVRPQNHFPPTIMSGPTKEQQELIEYDESFVEEEQEEEEEEENLLGLCEIPQHLLDNILAILDEDNDHVEEDSINDLQNGLVAPPKPTVEESGEDKEPTVEESGEDKEPTVKELGDDKEPTVEESGEDKEPTVQESGEDKEPTVQESVEDKKPTVQESGEDKEPTVQESGEDKESTVEESPPVRKTLKSKSKLRRNPVKRMFSRCLWIPNAFRACWQCNIP